jgi:hypothetical protein
MYHDCSRIVDAIMNTNRVYRWMFPSSLDLWARTESIHIGNVSVDGIYLGVFIALPELLEHQGKDDRY